MMAKCPLRYILGVTVWLVVDIKVSFTCRETLKQAGAELAAARRREQELRKTLEQKERRLADIEASLEGTEAKIADLRAELGTELLAQLSASERVELAKLAPKLKALQVTNSILGSHSAPRQTASGCCKCSSNHLKCKGQAWNRAAGTAVSEQARRDCQAGAQADGPAGVHYFLRELFCLTLVHV